MEIQNVPQALSMSLFYAYRKEEEPRTEMNEELEARRKTRLKNEHRR
jgi:hypothetical protein